MKVILSSLNLYYLMSFLFVLSSCDPNKRTAQEGKHGYDSTFSLIIWKNPNVSENDFRSALRTFSDSLGQITHSSYCGNCDSDLLELSGPGPDNFIQTQKVKGGNTSSGGTKVIGNDGEYAFYYSTNFNINIPDITSSVENPLTKTTSEIFYNATPPVVVSVFDTGVDSSFYNNDSYLADFHFPICQSGDNRGWNFVNNNNRTNDDNNAKHGTKVTDLILEQSFQYKKDKIQILPVKTHNNIGRGTLFDVLCGLAYVSKIHGIKAVNGSFGYPSKYSEFLLKKCIEHYLTKNQILFICAAGNGGVNLEDSLFYPACFSASLPNVITVTTVNEEKNEVSCDQNYSSKFVDIGVTSDYIIDSFPCKKYGFPTRVSPLKLINGSSYAAAIVTGIICTHYDLLTSGMNKINKSDLIKRMLKYSLAIEDHELTSVKNGIIVKKPL